MFKKTSEQQHLKTHEARLIIAYYSLNIMVSLSVVIITLNEERNIRRCLNSVQSIADDIVIIDSFSTDKTKAICLEYEVNFVEHLFEGYVEQKNYALTRAKYSYILSLDADEALDKTLQKSILKVKQNWTQDGYYLNRLTNYCGHWIYHSGWYPDKKLRLWNHQKGYWKSSSAGNCHEFYQMVKGSRIGYLAGNILHYSYYNPHEHVIVTYKYADISARSILKAKAKVTSLNLFINPIWRFLTSYFLRQGFRDGFWGLIIASISAYGTFLKYALVLYYRQRESDN